MHFQELMREFITPIVILCLLFLKKYVCDKRYVSLRAEKISVRMAFKSPLKWSSLLPPKILQTFCKFIIICIRQLANLHVTFSFSQVNGLSISLMASIYNPLFGRDSVLYEIISVIETENKDKCVFSYVVKTIYSGYGNSCSLYSVIYIQFSDVNESRYYLNTKQFIP